MAEPIPSSSAAAVALQSAECTPPLKKRFLSPMGSTCPPTGSNSSLEDSASSGLPKVGWPHLLPGGFDHGSDLDLDKHLSPAAYSRSTTQSSLSLSPPPPPNPSIKRRLHLSLSPSKHAEDSSNRPATKPKAVAAAAVPTAAKSSPPAACPPVAPLKLKLAPPPPPPQTVEAQLLPQPKAIAPVLPKPATPTAPPALERNAEPEHRPPPAKSAPHKDTAPDNAAPKAAPDQHAPPADKEQHEKPASVERRVSWADQTQVAPDAAKEPPTLAPTGVPPVKVPSPAVTPSPKATAPEEPPAPSGTQSSVPNAEQVQTEQPPHANTKQELAKHAPSNAEGAHPKHETCSPTKKEPTSSPDGKHAPTSILKTPPQPKTPPAAPKTAPKTAPAAPKTHPTRQPKAAPKSAPQQAQELETSSSLQQPPAGPPALDVSRVSVDAQAATPIVPVSYNERQALQGEFKRRIKEPEANNIPTEIVTLWEDLVKNNRKAAKTALFEKWLHAGKDWSLLIIENSKSHTDRSVGRKKMGWRTRAQIIALHGGDTHAADEIIAEKTSEGLVDHHPDSHHLKTYYVCTELGRKEEEETESKITMKTQAKLNCGGEAAQKLMGGITGDQVDNFFKLRTFQKPSHEGGGQASTDTTVLPQQIQKKPGTRKTTPKEMPSDPIEGLQWIVPKLLKDLTEAKMWPIKMATVKHQETLRDTLLAQSKDLESTFFEMKQILDQYNQDKDGFDPADDEEFPQKLANAVAARDAYAETASMANRLCKPKGGRRSANKAAEEE